MAKKPPTSTKRIQIDKNNATMVIIVAVAAFVTVFSLVASKALLSERSYQARVITEKKKALDQLKKNNQAANQLVASYKTFVGTPDNKIGGSSTGTGEKDGNNAKIILDALPSKYDYPALASSLEKILLSKNIKITGISGIDDELNQSGKTGLAAKPVDMIFKISVNANFETMKTLSDTFEQSIRPIYISKLTLGGKDTSLDASLEGKSYYQPEKTVKITTKVVK